MEKIQRHFDEELSELKATLLRMAGLAEEAIQQVIKALVDRDAVQAEKIRTGDHAINMLEIDVDELCLRILALRKPNAGDLRFVTSAMKINADLERIGDLAVNIAERTLNLLRFPQLKPLIDIPHMARIAQRMLNDSLTAFIDGNSALARDVCKRDDEVDQLNDQIFRELLTYMIQDPQAIERAVDLLLIARHLERIADHSTNICEDVIYLVDGRTIKHHVADQDDAPASPPAPGA